MRADVTTAHFKITTFLSTLQEAMTNAAGEKSEVSEAEITKAFKHADMDSDGFVSRQEAKRAYKRLSKLFSHPIDSVSSQTGKLSEKGASIEYSMYASEGAGGLTKKQIKEH